MSEKTNLFTPLHGAGLELANRIVMAPMTRRKSPGGVWGKLHPPYALNHPFPHVSPHAAVRETLVPLRRDRPTYQTCVSSKTQANGVP